ncbi:MAG TPA: Hsp70 family protein [Nocardioides sp.]|uniref:Hsp70 family protein n=1 Tax=Nocardioides sp. TaxID=35761 RepID=UPI002BC3D660|nr:Hsp70 family protein [Nocardioides sp.]HQR27716.1 Hsp70 family protein [Nocardioides sp.]
MRLGVDFGTTRTIVAAVDRGNYPIVAFHDPDGDTHDHVPSVAALDRGRLVFGHRALAAARDHGAPLARSFKRVLGSPEVHAGTTVRLGETEVPVVEVLTGYLAALREELRQRSTVADQLGATVSATVAVPAHAFGAQRFLTLQAFRAAGFDVLAMLNEPSAAGFEYTHRHARTLTSHRTQVVVYDLGGGTFDASVVGVEGTRHEVLSSVGLNHLGGDDFDQVLADLAVAAAGAEAGEALDRTALLEECRQAKERLTPQSRKILLEVADRAVAVPVGDFYEAAGPLVETTLDAMEPLVGEPGEAGAELSAVAGVYLVGGASALPLVPRRLRERFGRRVHSSPYPAASTAIGLAIAADTEAGYSLSDRLSRGFGVFREGRAGQEVAFDELLSRHERVSLEGDVVLSRAYRAAHNVGWFRFVEYVDLDVRGEPQGALLPFADVVFPFDAQLQDGRDLRDVEVLRVGHGPWIEEEYVIDRHGIIEVRITDHDTGYHRAFTLDLAAGS